MDKPTVYVGAEAWHKMLIYSKTTFDELGTEVGGMAEVHRTEENNWLIKNPIILKQDVSGTNTHLKKEALAEYLSHVVSKNKDAASKGDMLFLWWHTHPNFTASMSGTDWTTIEEYSENGSGLALVINNDGDYELIFSINEPVQAQVECDLQVLYDMDFNVKEEVEALCTKTVGVGVKRYNYGYNYNGVYDNSWVDEGNQMSLLPTNRKVKNGNGEVPDLRTEKEMNPELYDVDVDENGPFITHVDTHEEGSGLIDPNNFSIIDDATFEIDRVLKQLENEEIIPDQVIRTIEKVNEECKPHDIKFMVPEPKDVATIATAAELLEERDRYGLL